MTVDDNTRMLFHNLKSGHLIETFSPFVSLKEGAYCIADVAHYMGSRKRTDSNDLNTWSGI